MVNIETLRMKNIFKQFAFMAIFIIAFNFLFRALIYVIPAGLVLWFGYKALRKIKLTTKAYSKKFESKVQHKEISEDDEIKDIFNSFNLENKNIIDVEYEEVHS